MSIREHPPLGGGGGGGGGVLPYTEGYLNVRFSTDTGAFGNLTHTLEKDIPSGAPTGYTFPYGLFSFNVTQVNAGSTIKVTITFPDKIPAGSEYWKYLGGKWVNCTSLISDNDGDNVLILTLTDGGLGDADGLANGMISDPGGVAIKGASTLTTATMRIGQKSYTVGSSTSNMDVAPYVKNNRTYVPVRYLAYALGIAEKDVKWDAATKTVTLTKGSTVVKLVIGSKTLSKNGIASQMDVSPETTPPGRTMLPARWVAEAFGATVTWNKTTQTVTITY
ncbi:MAG: stalk domain-containing protein [Actinomycetota bacterium]|nr:stalk domain-containing protein [Actinomycetota bacterium]